MNHFITINGQPWLCSILKQLVDLVVQRAYDAGYYAGKIEQGASVSIYNDLQVKAITDRNATVRELKKLLEIE